MRPSLLLAIGLVVLGCGRRETAPQGPGPAASASAARAPDQLTPGEIGEGKEQIWGLKLPRGLTIDRQFDDVAFAVGTAPPEAVANYVRKRVVAEKVDVGPARTVFTMAAVKGEPSERRLRIEVSATRERTEVVVRDTTPKRVEPGLSDQERWNKAGLLPGGKQDTKTLQ